MANPLRRLVRAVRARLLRGPRKRWRNMQYVNQAASLRRKGKTLHSLDALVALPPLQRAGAFWSNQKPPEILPLLELLRDRQPQTICEIGTKAGGTLFLFSQVAASDATIISVDITYTSLQQKAFRKFVKPGQQLVTFAADSHAPETVTALERQLAGRQLDFLFIDGDHSFEGVAADYEAYARFVRPGGIIAFHDIVPDFRRRYNIETARDAGGVPDFWSSVAAQHAQVQEFIADPDQDGYGIGVVFWEANGIA